MELGLKNTVALITGSARGLGRAIAERLAVEKANVVITDINETMALSTAEEIAQKYHIKT